MGIGQKLEIKNVSKFYGSFQALENINLVCEPGSFVTILGSSGSGKTTLLKVIAGFEPGSSGKIYINGEDIAAQKAYERNIGMLFQNYALFPHMTVAENIAYPLKLRKLPKSEITERVENIIKMVKLNNMGGRYPRQLSGGQQQRAALARAIVYNPPLLLLDEPLGALDMNLRHDMQFEIKRITSELGMTTISVTHDQEEAFAMSDKICIMSNGKVQQFASPEEIYEHPSNKFVAEFMGTTNIVKIDKLHYERMNDKVKITGISELSENPFEFIIDDNGIRDNVESAMFAVRPENIHIAEPGKTYSDSFQVAIEESIYLGNNVKIKARKGDVILNINMSVNEFRSLGDPTAVNLYMDSASVTMIYE